MNDELPSSAGPPSHQRSTRPPREADRTLENRDRDGAKNDDLRKELDVRRRRATRKWIKFLDEVLRGLDTMIYTQLAIVYYMDCSFFRFFFRSLVQFTCLTPRPFRTRPSLPFIFSTNILCLLLHLYLSRPSAGEATRGYLHGGLLIDFVGQKGPTSKFHLALLDVAILGFQMVMMSVDLKRRKLRKAYADPSQTAGEPPDAQEEASAAAARQDVDAEERGVLRRSSIFSLPLESDETDELLAAPELRSTSSLAGSDPLDALNSGQVVIANLHILDTIRELYRAQREDAMASLPGGGSAAGFAADFAGRRFGEAAMRLVRR